MLMYMYMYMTFTQRLTLSLLLSFRDGVAGMASKALHTVDFCGQNYVCFLISLRNQLK